METQTRHDVESHLGKITAPTQITFGRYDMATSTRFADRMQANIQGAVCHVSSSLARGLGWSGRQS